MVLRLRIEHDLKRLQKTLSAAERRVFPAATVDALNRVAAASRKVATTAMPQHIDRPVPFTTKAILYEKASRKKLQSAVYMKKEQAAYLKTVVEGGYRTPAPGSRFVPVPTKHVKLNKYGNLRRRGADRSLSAGHLANTFTVGDGDPKLSPGIYQRYAKKKGRHTKVRQLVAFGKREWRAARFPYRRIVQESVRERFSRYLEEAVAKEMEKAARA
jgi:hypothetical protein